MGDNWEMPEPVFRSSEGEYVAASKHSAMELPYGSEHETLEPAAEPQPNETSDDRPEMDALASLYEPPDELAPGDGTIPEPNAAVEEIQEQPFVSEEFSADELLVGLPTESSSAVANGPAVSGSSGALRFLGAVFLLGLLITAGVFLYWYLTTARHD